MENVWGSAELMRTDVPSVEGEYLEAEVIGDDGRNETKRNHDLRFVRPLTVFLAVIFAVGMVSGYIGGGAFYATIEEISSLMAKLGGGGVGEVPVAPTTGGVPIGSSAITSDGLRIRCAGSFVKPGKGNGEPMVVVALEIQNVGADKVVMRKNQIAAISVDGKVVEPLDQTLSRGDGGAFNQFTSVVVEPGGSECLTVASSFYKASNLAQVMYRPGKRYRGYDADCTTFDIDGIQETLLA